MCHSGPGCSKSGNISFQWINRCPADKMYSNQCVLGAGMLDSDLSTG